jgi:hypothetical protein
MNIKFTELWFLNKFFVLILVWIQTPHQIPVLVQNLIVIETWKANAFPLLSARVSEAGSLKCYILLYHEAMLVNLLECALYTDGAVESLFASECAANHFAYAGGWQSEPSAVRMLAPWYGVGAAIECFIFWSDILLSADL